MFRAEKTSYKLLILMSILVVIALFLSGCGRENANNQQDKIVEEKNGESQNLAKKELKEEIENVEKQYSEKETAVDDQYNAVSPFTGLPLKEKYFKRAAAVSIENSPAARPQSGLAQAEIVYEFMVEGGITRFLALFWPDIPAKIGPIRSARPALIEISKLHDALFLHAGASPDGFEMIADNNILHLDQIYSSDYFWRSSKRKAPHNLYSGRPVLKDYLANLSEKEYPEYFNFLTASVSSDFKRAENITIDYWGSYEVFYKYNNLENNYARFLNQGKEAHLVESGEQIKVKNIIIQFAETATKDEEGRQKINLRAGGKMTLFRDGIVINGSWQNNNDNINYFNDKGEEIEINPGRTWIQIVPNQSEVSY